jgi:hypothetical protein
MNDCGQLGSAVPELRGTWRTRSSCSPLMLADVNDIQQGDGRTRSRVYRRLLQAAARDGRDQHRYQLDHVREHATAGLLD